VPDRVLIAGTNSGCGKTTVTTALLAALKARGVPVCAYKCGPDYIDPMFHRRAIGVASRNLDPYFSSPEELRAQLAAAAGPAVIEGVMGFYDGIGTEGRASTYEVAAATETPVILVLNAKGMYTSAAAMIRGYAQFRSDSNVRGVIFNGVSPMLYNGLREIAQNAGVRPLGCLPREESLAVESRHLGLVTADEIADLQEKIAALGALAERHLDLDGILALAAKAPALPAAPAPAAPIARVRIAVARDEAFCFLYQANLELLESLGADLAFFSPLRDARLPEGVGGLYLPGGYPELYVRALSENAAMRAAVRKAVESGMPTIAECGGFLYLHRTLEGAPMAGVIAADAHKTDRLQHFGYACLTAKTDSLLCRAGDRIRVHEFHYCDSTDCGEDFAAEKPSGARSYLCGHATESLYAGFPHLYLPASAESARRFVRRAAAFAESGGSAC